MKRTILLLTLVGALLLACTGVVLAQSTSPAAPTTTPAGSAPASAEDPIPNQYIVLLDDKEDAKQASKDAEKDHGAKVKHVYENAVKGYAAELSDKEVDKLKKDNKHHVRLVSQDHKVHMTQTSSYQTPPTGDDRIDGEPNPVSGSDGTFADGSSVGVAVIDTGIDLNNQDLSNVQPGTNCVNPGSSAQDDAGHGTHVAGTIAARNDVAGVVGIVPGATLYPVKVLDSSGSGTDSQVICGIDWVYAHAKDANNTQKIHVANMSLGGWVNGASLLDDGNCGNINGDPEHLAICHATSGDPQATDPGYKSGAGITFAVAAANDAWPIEDKAYSNWSERPGVYDEVLTSTAIADYNGKAGGGAGTTCSNYGSDDTPASFSNWSETTADANHTIAGPGACILSTKLGGGTTTMSGTSMATPHVAGTAALCIAKGTCPKNDPKTTLSQLRSDAEHYDINNAYGFQKDPNSSPASGWTSGTTKYYGYLVLAGNYRSGVTTAVPPPTDTTAPTVSSVSPSNGATGVSRTTTVIATFSEAMDKTSVEATDPTTGKPINFTLVRASDGASISATVSYDATTNKVTLKPSSALATSTKYTATVKGGASGAKDKAGNPLASDKVWSFTTNRK